MSTSELELNAEPRGRLGKGENRRLRNVGKVPAILYGVGDPTPITLIHHEVLRRLEHESFYSRVLSLRIGDRVERAILKDIHRHPAKAMIMHMDFQRVDATKKIHMRVPLHFLNETTAPGVKISGGRVSRLMNSVEVECTIDALPEYLEVDLATLEMGHTIHLSNLQLPTGVAIRGLTGGDDKPVVAIAGQRAEGEAEPEKVTEAAPKAAAPTKSAAPKVAPAKTAAKAAPAAKTTAKPAAKPAAKAPAKAAGKK